MRCARSALGLPDTLLAEGLTPDRRSAFLLSPLVKAVSSIEVQCWQVKKKNYSHLSAFAIERKRAL